MWQSGIAVVHSRGVISFQSKCSSRKRLEYFAVCLQTRRLNLWRKSESGKTKKNFPDLSAWIITSHWPGKHELKLLKYVASIQFDMELEMESVYYSKCITFLSASPHLAYI